MFDDITYLFNPFGIIMIFILFEVLFRAYNLITLKKIKSNKYIIIDLVIHIIAVICFFMYEIIFIVLQNM